MSRRISRVLFPVISEASLSFLKEFSECLKRSSSFQELHNDMTHVLNVPALDVRSVGKFDFVAEIFTCSLGGWIVPRKPTLRSGFCRAEENFDLVSNLR